MTRGGFSTCCTSSRAGLATLLAVAIAGGCGARTAAPTARVTVPDTHAAQAAELDEAGCLALLVPEPAARVRCNDDHRGPCVTEIALERFQTSPPRYVCHVLVASEDWEARDGQEEVHVSTGGTYTLAVIDSAEGAWTAGDTKQYEYFGYHAYHKGATIEFATIGPDRKAVVVSVWDGQDAYGTTEVTFYLVTSRGFTEILWFTSEVETDGKKEYSYRVDDEVTTAGYHDIVLSGEEESWGEPEEGEDGSDRMRFWEERYRWNGTEYVQVEDEIDGEDEGE